GRHLRPSVPGRAGPCPEKGRTRRPLGWRVLSRRARVRGVVGPRARCTPRTCVLGAADVVADGLDAVVGHVDEQVVVADAVVDDADDPVVGVAGAVTGGDALEA